MYTKKLQNKVCYGTQTLLLSKGSYTVTLCVPALSSQYQPSVVAVFVTLGTSVDRANSSKTFAFNVSIGALYSFLNVTNIIVIFI